MSMDGLDVNLKLLEKTSEERTSNEFHRPIFIESCGLHLINGALRAGVDATEWNIEKILTGTYYVLHDSPARKEDYHKVTGSNKFPLNFCSTQ